MVLQRQDAPLPFAAWRDAQRPKLAAAPSRVLLGLVPPGWQPSVALAPIVGERPWFDEELDAVLEFSPRPAGGRPRLPQPPARRAGGRPDALDPPPRGPLVRPFLEVRIPGPGRQVELAGRGLVLVPSVFAWPDPALLLDGDGQPVLLYPARDLLSVWTMPGYDRDLLGALLGATRAAVLVAAARGDSTSHLADRLNVSVASVSQHLTTLRTAGLVRSTRRARAVHHDLTPLGVQLLLASGPFSQA